MKVNFVDLKAQYAGKIYQEVARKMKTGQFMGAGSFEDRFAKYHGIEHCVGVGSGTDALWLALLALGVGPGDEVIVPANTYIATAFAVSHTGATPVFADVDPHGYILQPVGIKACLTDKTKAIIPVHLYGQPCNMPVIMEIARENNLFVVEDCAQAAGAKLFNQYVGTFGNAGCFSFYPTKNLGGLGQGGAVITDNEELAIKIRELGNVGRKDGSWYEYSYIGFNSRLDAVNAAFLEENLRYLKQWNDKRAALAIQYEDELKSLEGVYTAATATFDVMAVFHLYELKVDSKRTRTWLSKHLNKNGVQTGLHYPIPCHKQPMYKHMKAQCPVAEELADTLLSLPMHPFLKPEEVSYVCDTIKEWFSRR